VLEYLQVMIFANMFAITSNPQYLQDVKELVLSLLEDEQLEASIHLTVKRESCAFDKMSLTKINLTSKFVSLCSILVLRDLLLIIVNM